MSAPKNDRAGVRQIVKGLMDAGHTFRHVDYGDGETSDPISTLDDAVEEVMAVDDAFLVLTSGSWVRFVMGNDPEEVVCDHTVDLSDVIDPITEEWWA